MKLLIFMAGLAVGAACCFLWLDGRRAAVPAEVVVRVDTVRVVEPSAVSVSTVSTRRCRLPLARPRSAVEPAPIDSVETPTDETAGVGCDSVGCDSVGCDSVDVAVPIERVEYSGDGYKAYLSGYKPVLDSLVFARAVTVSPVVRRQSRERRFSIGIQAGYGFTPAGLQPYVGVGVSFRLY